MPPPNPTPAHRVSARWTATATMTRARRRAPPTLDPACAVAHRGDHAVDHPVPLQVLRGLDPGGKRFAVELLVDARAQETDQRAGLGDGDVSQRAPRREHPAGGRIAQVDQVGQVCLLVQGDGCGDLDHLQECDCAFLHAGAAGARRRQQRQPLRRCTLHRGGDPFGRRHTDRAAEEAEFTDHHRYAATEDPALSGQHRLVDAGSGPGGGQLASVGLEVGTGVGAVSQLTNDPSSSTASRSLSSPMRRPFTSPRRAQIMRVGGCLPGAASART